jgi:hypothetical protein
MENRQESADVKKGERNNNIPTIKSCRRFCLLSSDMMPSSSASRCSTSALSDHFFTTTLCSGKRPRGSSTPSPTAKAHDGCVMGFFIEPNTCKGIEFTTG